MHPAVFRVLCMAAGLAAMLAAAAPAPAVIISGGTGTGNTTPPAGFPYWDAIGTVGGGTGIYLGNGYVLTAQHIHDIDAPSSVTFAGVSYPIDQGSWQEIQNVSNGLSYAADMTLFRVSGAHPAVTPVPTSGIPASTTATGTTVYLFGYGFDRDPPLTTWYVDTTPSTWVWNTSPFTGWDATYTGYWWGGTHSMRWGTNAVASHEAETYGFSYGGGLIRNVSTWGYTVNFSAAAGDNECEVAIGDSGGPTFTYDDGWKLTGVNVTRGNMYNNQPTYAAIYGNTSSFTDLSSYASQLALIGQSQWQPASHGASGQWNESAKWDAGQPSADLSAILGNGGTVTVSGTAAAVAGNLAVNNRSTLNLTGGSLLVPGTFSKDSNSTFGFSGGDLTVSTLGFGPTQTGGRLWVKDRDTTVTGAYLVNSTGASAPVIQVEAGRLLTVSGNLTFSAAGGPDAQVVLALNGTAGGSFAQVAVAGSVNFGGTDAATSKANLVVILPAFPSFSGVPISVTGTGNSPVLGNFDVLTYAGRTGGSRFAAVTALSAGAVNKWAVVGTPVTYDDAGGEATLNGSGLVWTARPGDADLNGMVNLADLTALATNYGTSGAGVTWASGDFDCNGLVNLADLTTLATAYGTSSGGDPVPEPGSLALLALGAAALLRRRR